MLQEFKDFINRGNVVDLAVAVVIGGAFGLVIASFTDDVLLQIVAAVVGEPDFSSLSFDLGDAEIRYGAFFTTLLNFLIIAAAVFIVVKGVTMVQRKEDEEAGPTEVELLTEIRDALRQRS